MSAAGPRRPGVRIAPSADVDDTAEIGTGTSVWQWATVREHAQLGRDCVVGRGAYIDDRVRLGDRVKVQNLALVYAPAVLEDGVFVGPAVVLTNDVYPRSEAPDGTLKRAADWRADGVTVRQGASLGARSVVVAGCTVGRHALVGAGAVVTQDVPDFALVVGIPARRVGWVGRVGVPLRPAGADAADQWVCPVTGESYRADGERLVQQ